MPPRPARDRLDRRSLRGQHSRFEPRQPSRHVRRCREAVGQPVCAFTIVRPRRGREPRRRPWQDASKHPRRIPRAFPMDEMTVVSEVPVGQQFVAAEQLLHSAAYSEGIGVRKGANADVVSLHSGDGAAGIAFHHDGRVKPADAEAGFRVMTARPPRLKVRPTPGQSDLPVAFGSAGTAGFNMAACIQSPTMRSLILRYALSEPCPTGAVTPTSGGQPVGAGQAPAAVIRTMALTCPRPACRM